MPRKCEWTFEGEKCPELQIHHKRYDWECNPTVTLCEIGQYETLSNASNAENDYKISKMIIGLLTSNASTDFETKYIRLKSTRYNSENSFTSKEENCAERVTHWK